MKSDFIKKTFPFFFGLICFLFISMVYSLPVSATGLSTHIPAPPTGVDNFVVGYMPKSDTYRLGSTDYTGNIYITGDTLTDSTGKSITFGDRYELVDGAWELYSSGQGWNGWYDDVSLASGSGDKVIVFSSSNFYGTDGTLLASSASDDILNKGLTVVGKGVSSSKILTYMFAPFRQILPIILVVVVFILAIYKGLGWLRGQVKGA